MRYRKKPVVVEAIRFEYSKVGIENLKAFVGESAGNIETLEAFVKDRHPNAVGVVRIKTLEGSMLATEGDYIIKGVKGEFYPCKPDIFEKTYEPVDELAEALANLHKQLLPD
jgi:hypothetical protein